jgi:cytidine deaminase
MNLSKQSDSLTQAERSQLLQAATLVATNAHAKYSNFRVGAAVLGEQKTYLGVNVENASYGLAICAERAALAAAVAAGEKNIRALAIACLDASTDETKMPCGACRQWIQELAPMAEILIMGDEDPLHLEELLPRPFKVGY